MYLVQMVSSMCGGNQVRSTKTSVSKTSVPTVKHGGRSVMVWGCIEGTMRVNMHCDLLKQSMIPSLWRMGRRAVFQHNVHWLAKEAEG